jgi:hypothetical protein
LKSVLSFSGELSGFVQTPLDPSITDSPHSLAVAISQIRVVRFPSGSIVRIGDPPHPHPGPLVAMQAINRPHDSKEGIQVAVIEFIFFFVS